MSVTKRISGDYNITNVGTGLTSGNVTITTNTLFVNGNMLVGGTSTTVNHTDLAVTDNLIILNKGETSAGVSLIYSGIEVDRGLSTNVQVRWNETSKYWELSNDGASYTQIATTTGGQALGNVYQDPKPAISANLDLRGHNIWDSVNSSGNVRVSFGAVGSGGTGVYVTNTQYTNKELMIGARSFAYSLLFG